MDIAIPEDVSSDAPRACDQPFYFMTIASEPAAAAAAPSGAANGQEAAERARRQAPPPQTPPVASAPASAGAANPRNAETPLPTSRGAGAAAGGAEPQAHAAGKPNGALEHDAGGSRGLNGSASGVVEEKSKGAEKPGGGRRLPVCGCSIC